MEEDSVIDESPNSDLLSRMVGHSNESNIIVNGEKTCALIIRYWLYDYLYVRKVLPFIES